MKKKIAAKIRAAVSGLTSTAASASTVAAAAAAAATATPTSTIAAHEIPPPRVNPMQVQAARQELASRELVPYVEFVHKPALSTARHMAEWADIFMHPSKTKPHTLIIAPPGSSKTSWSSKFLPCFLIGQNPGLHVGVVTSTAKRAWKLSLACRDTVTEVPEYQQVFPHVRPNKAKGWARDQWFVERPQKDDPDPTMTSCGLFGDILGSRLDFLIFDDIFDEETIGSDTLRERGRKWVRNTAMTRLDPSKGRAVAILTRWSGVTEDLVAEFEKDKRWQIIKMPAIGYFGDGNSLWPDRLPLQFLLDEQERDPLGFEAVYQGNPSLAEGDIFKRAWWKWMDLDAWPDKFEMIVQAWDTAYKKGKKNDYSSCVTLGILRGGIFVLHVLREKLTWPELVEAANKQFYAFRPRTVLIEDSASGQSLLQQLKVQSEPMIPVHESQRGQQDKRSFVLPVTGYVQGGRVWLPKDVPWAKRFVSSLGNFNPDREQKDDEVLAFTHGMLWLTKSKSVSLTQDCLIKPSGLSENVGSMGTRFATQLGLGGSPGGSWFDQM